jgi:hypothetical protein
VGGGAGPPPASSPPSGRTTIPIAKVPTGFYAYGFAPDRPQVEPGNTVTLSWYGSADAIYTIAYDDDVAPVAVNPPAWSSTPLYVPTSQNNVAVGRGVIVLPPNE